MSVTWLDGVELSVSFGYDYRPFEDPGVDWVDETAYVRRFDLQSPTRPAEVGEFSPGQATFVLDNRSRRFDAAYGPASVTFDGTSGNYFSAGDLAAFSGATALDVRAAVALDDWTPTLSGTASIVSQFGAAGQRSWSVAVTAGGFLELTTSSNGTAATTTDSGVMATAVNGQVMCVRITWQSSDGATNYYVKRTSPARAKADCLDHDGWVQLGSTDTNGTAALFNATSAVCIGERAAGDQELFGSVYYCDARTTIGSDTLAFAFWPQDAADSTDTSWTASAGAGETWTGTGSAYALVDAGELYGALLPGVPVRVVANYDSTSYPLWSGYVRRWTSGYAVGGVDATVTVQAVDAFGWMATMPAPASAYAVGIDRDDAYWPLHESSGREFADEHGPAHGSWSQIGSAGEPLPPGSPAATRSLSSASAIAPDLASIPTLPGVAYSPALMFWVHLEETTSAFRVFAKGESSDGTKVCLGVNYGVGGSYYLHGQTDGGSSWSVPIVGRLDVGSHHIALLDTGGSFGGLYVDLFSGLGVGAQAAAVVDTTNAAGLYIDGYLASVSDVSLGATGVDATIYGAGANGRALESSADRVDWLLAAAGMTDPALLNLSTTVSSFLGPATGGGTWASQLKQVDAAEAGLLYVDGDGAATFITRVDLSTGARFTTSQATFGEESGEVAYSDIEVSAADIDDVVNVATVSIASGAAGSYRDETSIALYGQSTVSTSAPLASTGEAANLARHLVGLRAHPGVRVRRLELTPRSDPATMYPQALGRLIGDRITVRRRPTDTLIPSTPTPEIDVDVRIEGIRHSVTPDNWVTSFVTAPAPLTAQEAGLFTADDAILGVVDSGVVVAY